MKVCNYLSSLFIASCLIWLGCGKTPPPADQSAPQPVAPVGAQPGEVDLASLKAFPELKFVANGTYPEEGDPRVLFMDGEPVQKASGQPSEPYWVAKPPTSVEVYAPGHITVGKVAVEDVGGEKALPQCSVSVKTDDKPDWHPPDGLIFHRETIPNSTTTRHIIEFDKAHASAIRVNFPGGNQAQPDRVYVSDIDIFGEVGK
jgi:hypothetical protein